MALTQADDPSSASTDRVRRSTAEKINLAIDRQIDSNVRKYAGTGQAAIAARIKELECEWDIERVLEVNASTLALTGLALGISVDRRWLAVPAVVLPFLLLHGLRGWCPPLPVLRRMGIRTRGEIDREKYALLASLEDRNSN